MKTIRMVCVFLGFLSLVLSLAAQTPHTLHVFDLTNGGSPYATLIQGTDGDFYGTTSQGGANNGGTVFKVSSTGALTTIYNFCALPLCADGKMPNAGLVQAANGSFYGTTYAGGADYGTVFEITPTDKLATLKTLYTFCATGHGDCPDGDYPTGTLVQATDGNFYGTTWDGGANYAGYCIYGCGTVFKITPAGGLTTLHSFGAINDGFNPFVAGLIQGSNGLLYGTTSASITGFGTVFEITTGGTLTTLHIFDDTDGSFPLGGLVQAADGNFYGTTEVGGANTVGTVFKMTPAGTLTTIYNFCPQTGCPDGKNPVAGLIQATDGNLYGATYMGGTDGEGGTLFKITTGGALTTLYRFCLQSNCPGGGNPRGGLLQGTDGNFYGTTLDFGTGGDGTVFSLSEGLAPFVALSPTSGKVGGVIRILGQGFTGTTGVSFNGAAATFTVRSGAYLSATVPSGATTGFVSVVTPGGTLTSNREFRVRPQITSLSVPDGPVGTQVIITGVSLTQTTRVTFGGVKAITFTVNSDTQVTATVPTTAVTGKIAIVTPGGTATSPTDFTVTP
jgi:uncharacterized repeat protein (TIGR03803 family)